MQPDTELVRRGEVSPTELVEAAIARIENVNPALDAVVRTRFDRARAEAAGGLGHGPFRGVPVLLKDLGCLVAGEQTSFGVGPMWGRDLAGHLVLCRPLPAGRLRVAGPDQHP